MIKKILALFITISFALLLTNVISAQRNSEELTITVFVSDSKDFESEWLNKSFSEIPRIRRINRAKINQLVHAGFIISGYSLTDEQTCDFQISVKVFDPNNKIVFEDNNFAKHDKNIPKRGYIMGNQVLDFMLEPGDPVGTYKIEATVKDNLVKKEAKGEYFIEIE